MEDRFSCCLSLIILLSATLFFWLFGSADIQSWNNTSSSQTNIPQIIDQTEVSASNAQLSSEPQNFGLANDQFWINFQEQPDRQKNAYQTESSAPPYFLMSDESQNINRLYPALTGINT